MSYYIYAETAFHHEGDKNYILKLIDEAKKAGVHGIKFQVLIELNAFTSKYHSSYEESKLLLFSFEEWKEILNYTKSLELDIILMPLDIKAFDLIEIFPIKYIEIHSVSFMDETLLQQLDTVNLPIIFGIGGRTLDEIDEHLHRYQNNKIILMVGFQSFPSNIKDIKLGRIKALKELYPKCTIGYADHSSFDDKMAIASNEYAYILGARIFEKHITINEGAQRIDYESAISSHKIKSIIHKLDFLEKILCSDNESLFTMTEKEIVYKNRQKLPVANKDLSKGTIIDESMISYKMIDTTNIIDTKYKLLGRTLLNDILKDKPFVERLLS